MTAPNSQGTAGPEPTRCPTPPDDACIVVVRDGSLVVAVVAGELDLVSEPTVRAELRSAWNGSSGVDALAVYVRDVTFCDARGLGSLLATRSAALAAGVSFALVAPPSALTRLLCIVDPDGEVATYPRLRDAIATLRPERS